MRSNHVIDTAHHQRAKDGERACGDVCVTRHLPEEGRVVAVLSDGLGSGIKAGVLAALTASMAARYAGDGADLRESAAHILDTLPVCRERRVSYSTFTVVDMDVHGRTTVVEHGNPLLSVWRGAERRELSRHSLRLPRWQDRLIHHARFQLEGDDRLVFASDGVTQAGTGRLETPMGWGEEGLAGRIAAWLRANPSLEARRLSLDVVDAARDLDGGAVLDDMSCVVMHLRKPRKLLLLAGPPYHREQDAAWIDAMRAWEGRIAVCGGTTAQVLARGLDRELIPLDAFASSEVPPGARLEGIDLVTEGALTLGAVATRLEDRLPATPKPRDPAEALHALLLDSDEITLRIGTRVNEAHVGPKTARPPELRQHLAARLARRLTREHGKVVHLEYN